AAAERFRRADWKTKAQEAAVRLGAEVPAVDTAQASGEPTLMPPLPAAESATETSSQGAGTAESSPAPADAVAETEEAATATAGESADSPDKKRRRRGRRGGRNRRKSEVSKTGAPGSTSTTTESAAPAKGLPSRVFDEPSAPRPTRSTSSRAIPQLPVEPIGDPAGPAVRGRSGDPGLSSRLSLLEMQLRRLLTCSPVKLSEADHAPVGPGVFVLTDSDLTSYYYVEACQTLRIAVANLLRGGTSRRGADSLKPQLAEHLGIPETRVTKYLADHCVVRWLQLDEGASHFAHFVTAVIRPTLNE
ncbi:MAG TPA: hypothetical protein VGI46_05280, partial [Candidatus Acidoferrum sp.]